MPVASLGRHMPLDNNDHEQVERIPAEIGRPGKDRDVYLCRAVLWLPFPGGNVQIVDTMNHQLEKPKQAGALLIDDAANFVDPCLRDVSGSKTMVRRYHGYASTKCKDMPATDAEYQETACPCEDKGYNGPLKNSPAARWKRHSKLVFSRNAHRLVCLVWSAPGKTDPEEADSSRIGLLILLLHNIINEQFWLQHDDLKQFLLFASFDLHARVVDEAARKMSGSYYPSIRVIFATRHCSGRNCRNMAVPSVQPARGFSRSSIP